jgi:hypothetical protein
MPPSKGPYPGLRVKSSAVSEAAWFSARHKQHGEAHGRSNPRCRGFKLVERLGQEPEGGSPTFDLPS